MDLAEMEEICQVKYRYLRCVDLKLRDELAEVFTPGATVDYGTQVYGKPLKLAGRDAIVGFLRKRLGSDTITVHRVGQPEITVDGDVARGGGAADLRRDRGGHRPAPTARAGRGRGRGGLPGLTAGPGDHRAVPRRQLRPVPPSSPWVRPGTWPAPG